MTRITSTQLAQPLKREIVGSKFSFLNFWFGWGVYALSTSQRATNALPPLVTTALQGPLLADRLSKAWSTVQTIEALADRVGRRQALGLEVQGSQVEGLTVESARLTHHLLSAANLTPWVKAFVAIPPLALARHTLGFLLATHSLFDGRRQSAKSARAAELIGETPDLTPDAGDLTGRFTAWQKTVNDAEQEAGKNQHEMTEEMRALRDLEMSALVRDEVGSAVGGRIVTLAQAFERVSTLERSYQLISEKVQGEKNATPQEDLPEKATNQGLQRLSQLITWATDKEEFKEVKEQILQAGGSIVATMTEEVRRQKLIQKLQKGMSCALLVLSFLGICTAAMLIATNPMLAVYALAAQIACELLLQAIVAYKWMAFLRSEVDRPLLKAIQDRIMTPMLEKLGIDIPTEETPTEEIPSDRVERSDGEIRSDIDGENLMFEEPGA